MKILFVSSGNSPTTISPITKNQGESLIKEGADLTYFTIQGKGLFGYLKAIPKLRRALKQNNYDVVHAHYSLSAYVASLAGAKPLVVSLMGSDVGSRNLFKFFIKSFNRLFWDAVIVKSKEMKEMIGLKDAQVIPNGVNFDKFKPYDRAQMQDQLNWDRSKKHVLFASSPKRPEKNYDLANTAFLKLADTKLELHVLENVANKDIPFYLNASNVLLLTSLREGSPNIIKEAMACAVPIVATDVGDVRANIAATDGCFVCNFDAATIAQCLEKALRFEGQTTGRAAISWLDESNIAKSILGIYRNLI